MQTDKVSIGHQRAQVLDFVNLAGQSPCGINGQGRVVAKHGHTQIDCHAGHHGADGAQADDTKRFTCQLLAGETLLLGFQQFGHRCVIGHFIKGVDVGHARQNAARRQQHAGQNQLLDRVGVGAGRVEDNNATFSAVADRHVIDTCAGTGDSTD